MPQPTQQLISDDSPASHRPRRLVVAGWVGLGVLAVMTMLMAPDTRNSVFQPLDDWWRGVVGSAPTDPLVHSWVAMFFQHLGMTVGTIILAIVIPIAFIAVGRWRTGLYQLACMALGAGALTQIIKKSVERPRPAAGVLGSGLAPDGGSGGGPSGHELWGPVFSVDVGSFPSGHSAAAGVCVVALFAVLPSSWVVVRKIWPVIAVVLAGGMMWQRTLTNSHWLSDTVAGLITGASVALLLLWVFYPWIAEERTRPVTYWLSARPPHTPHPTPHRQK